MAIIMLEKGNLAIVPFPYLIQEIGNRSATGLLSLTAGDKWKNIYFRNGSTISALSNSPDEQLIEIMYRGGVFEQSERDKINLLVKESGWRAPVVQQHVDNQKQKWWMRTVIREVFLSSMEWSAGDYIFHPRKSPPDSMITVDMETDKLLISIILRLQDLDVLARILGGYDTIPVIDPSAFSGVAARSLTAQDGFFLSRIDGKMNLKSILSLGGGQKPDMLRCYVQASLNGLIKREFAYPDIQDVAEEPSLPESAKTVDLPEETELPVHEPVKEQPEDIRLIDDSEDIMLTTDELRDLRKLAGRLDENFLDLSKNLDLENQKAAEKLGYDIKVSYLRGDAFIDSDGAESAFDVDRLGKISSEEDWTSNRSLDERISLIIGGKVVDGESDMFGSGLSKEIFENQDAEKQWNMWMISEEEYQNADQDWTATWTDWIEHAGELNELRRKTEELEAGLKVANDEKLKESILQDLKKHSAEMQVAIKRKKRQIFALHRRMQLMNYYDLLRVDRQATPEMIESAFQDWEETITPNEEMIRDFVSIAPQINQIIDLLKEAHKVLSDPELKVQYDSQLVEQEKATEAMRNKKALLAEDHLHSARTAARRGDTMLALRFLRGSISLDPTRALYFQEMAHILAENQNWRREALRFYHRAFHLDPENPDIMLDVAQLAKELNLIGFARKVLNQVMNLDPGNAKARKLMKSLNMTT
ncbi:DUF4388 domain-containing protein [bacterium]|nr:DUF4388 domain-containing protein [candidate division CSSED10-310 bacterium]